MLPIEQRRRNLAILFNNTTIVPYKLRGQCLCFFCSTVMTDRQQLIDHNQTHLPCCTKDKSLKVLKGTEVEVTIDVSEIQCKVCSEPFNDIPNLEFHLAHKHDLSYDLETKVSFDKYRLIDFKCMICDAEHKTLNSLVKHTNKVHQLNYLECNDCGQSFRRKKELRSHINQHNKVFICLKCPKRFKLKAEYRRHKNEGHVSQCCLCFKTFSTLSLRIKHMKDEHDIALGATCGFCNTKLNSRFGFLDHAGKCSAERPIKSEVVEIKTVTDMVAMREAKKITRDKIAYIFNNTTIFPFKRFHNKFRCFYCPKEFNICNDLKEHSMEEHPNCDVRLKSMNLKGLGRKLFIKIDCSILTCKLCNHQYDNLKSLMTHLETEHEAKLDNCVDKFQPFQLLEDKYPCPQCGKEFLHFSHTLVHFNKEHVVNRVICVSCGESFHNVTALQTHTTLHHTTPDRYKCYSCDLGFHKKKQLARHMGTAHKKKTFQCTHCPESFTSEYAKIVHVTKEHNAYKCSHCNAFFPTPFKMDQHVKRIHFHEKNVKCTQCDKTFFDQRRLKKHMGLHIRKKAFSCDYCDKSFMWKKNLTKHVNVHLGKEDHN